MVQEYNVLTPELRQQFLEKGWVKIENAVPLENIKSFSDDIWIRLGFDPSDKSTWTKEKVSVVRAGFSLCLRFNSSASIFSDTYSSSSRNGDGGVRSERLASNL